MWGQIDMSGVLNAVKSPTAKAYWAQPNSLANGEQYWLGGRKVMWSSVGGGGYM